jgi:hypothetical protein
LSALGNLWRSLRAKQQRTREPHLTLASVANGLRRPKCMDDGQQPLPPPRQPLPFTPPRQPSPQQPPSPPSRLSQRPPSPSQQQPTRQSSSQILPTPLPPSAPEETLFNTLPTHTAVSPPINAKLPAPASPASKPVGVDYFAAPPIGFALAPPYSAAPVADDDKKGCESLPDVALSASLRSLVEGLRLGDDDTARALCAADAWIAEMGFDGVAEIVEVGATHELVAQLGLKPGKARLLGKRIDERYADHAPSQAQQLTAVPVGEPVPHTTEGTRGRAPDALHSPAAVPMGSGTALTAPADGHVLDWRALALAYTRAESIHEARSACV